MERVYLLLRNNRQTGPFTIAELLQQQLLSSDMIWIEGKSTAWTYLTELQLSPFAKDSQVPDTTNDKGHEDEIERKAEELRQRVLASTPRTYFPKHITEIETYSSPYKMPEEPIQFVDYRKEKNAKRNAVVGEFLLTCLVIGLFVVGIFKGKSFLAVEKKVQNSVATQLDSGDEHAAQRPKPVSQSVVFTSDTVVTRPDSLLAIQKPHQKISPRKRTFDSSIILKPVSPITLNQPQKKEDTQSRTQNPVDVSVKKGVLAKKELIPAVQDVKSNTEPVKEEKKGFLRGLFKKKKNQSEHKTVGKDESN